MILSLCMALAAIASDTLPPPADTVPPVTDGPDRSTPPAVLPALVLQHPAMEHIPLAPGLTLHAARVPGLQRVQLYATVWGGGLALGDTPPVGPQTAAVLRDLAAKGWSASTLEAYQETHDAFVVSTGDLRWQGLQVDALPDTFDEALEPVRALLVAPTYPGADVRRYTREQAETLVLRDPLSAYAVLSALNSYATFPAAHPAGAPVDLSALKRLSPGRLKDLAARLLTTGPADLVLVGDVDPADWVEPLRATFAGVGQDTARPELLAAPPPVPTRVFAVDLPSAAQATLLVQTKAPAREGADEAAFSAVHHALGGAFLSRLNKVIREDLGLTYGVRARWTPDDAFGLWTASLQTDASTAGQAVTALQDILAEVCAEGITADEIDAAARARIGAWNGALETTGSALALYDSLVERDLSIEEARADAMAGRDVTLAEAKASAARWLCADDKLWIAVGPRDVIEPQLTERFPDVTWVSPEEAIMGTFPRGLPEEGEPVSR